MQRLRGNEQSTIGVPAGVANAMLVAIATYPNAQTAISALRNLLEMEKQAASTS